MKLNFKKWLIETMTSTASVANFALPCIRNSSIIKRFDIKKNKKKKENFI
jgi:hypothetical protein